MNKEKYTISVGEPWDFESQDGQNLIKGNILSKKSNECLVFNCNYDLEFEGIKGNILILRTR